jgi:hypothetical protein
MARGIFKVINWLNPPASRRRESVHSTLEQALEWVEQERPDAVPALRVLYERAGQGARGA